MNASWSVADVPFTFSDQLFREPPHSSGSPHCVWLCNTNSLVLLFTKFTPFTIFSWFARFARFTLSNIFTDFAIFTRVISFTMFTICQVVPRENSEGIEPSDTVDMFPQIVTFLQFNCSIAMFQTNPFDQILTGSKSVQTDFDPVNICSNEF